MLQPYYSNVSKRLLKTPKLYFLDTGLCAYLTEWSSPETLEAGAMSGAFLETWIFAELLKSYWHNGREAPFYYYRDRDQKEIDLLIVRDGKVPPPFQGLAKGAPFTPGFPLVTLDFIPSAPLGPDALALLGERSEQSITVLPGQARW